MVCMFCTCSLQLAVIEFVNLWEHQSDAGSAGERNPLSIGGASNFKRSLFLSLVTSQRATWTTLSCCATGKWKHWLVHLISLIADYVEIPVAEDQFDVTPVRKHYQLQTEACSRKSRWMGDHKDLPVEVLFEIANEVPIEITTSLSYQVSQRSSRTYCKTNVIEWRRYGVVWRLECCFGHRCPHGHGLDWIDATAQNLMISLSYAI